MITHRSYPKPPITEAVIDIRCRLPESVTLQKLESLHEKIPDRYPTKERRTLMRGPFAAGRQVSTTASTEPFGFLFKSRDGKQIFQAQREGFSVSRLAPYQGWEALRDEARWLWELYREAAKPESLTRLAIRTINRIDIPFPFEDLKEFLRTYPEVSPELPQALNGLFMHLTIPQTDIQSVTLLNQALVPPGRPNIASIILDIDVFRSDDIPQDEQVAWKFFEVLHDRKNTTFEACVTDRARELFQ